MSDIYLVAIVLIQKLRLSPNKPSLLPVCLTHPVAPMVWAFLAVKVGSCEVFAIVYFLPPAPTR